MPRLSFAPCVAIGLMAGVMSGCAIKMPAVLQQPEYRPWPGVASDVGVGLNGLGMATVPKDGLIVVEGDEPAYGADPLGGAPGINESSAPRSKTPFPETLQKYLGVQVENRGYPGDTIAEGAERWAGRPSGNLLIIAYGYSDAKAKTPAADFAASLKTMIEKGQAEGAAVILLIPPTYAGRALSRSEAPLQAAIRTAQVTYRTNAVDLQKVIASVAATEPNILSDPDLSHPKKPANSSLLPSLPNPLAGREAKAKESAARNAALFVRIADLLANDVAVVR